MLPDFGNPLNDHLAHPAAAREVFLVANPKVGRETAGVVDQYDFPGLRNQKVGEVAIDVYDQLVAVMMRSSVLRMVSTWTR